MKGAKQNVVSGWLQHGRSLELPWTPLKKITGVSRLPLGTVLMQFNRRRLSERFVWSKLVGRKTCCLGFEVFRPSEQCLVTSRIENQTLCAVKVPGNNSSRPLTSYERDCRRRLPGIPVHEAGRGVLSTINVAVLSWPERSSSSEVIRHFRRGQNRGREFMTTSFTEPCRQIWLRMSSTELFLLQIFVK